MKQLLPILLLLVACKSPEPSTTSTENSQKLKDLGMQYVQYFNAHDWNKLSLMYTAEVELYLPNNSGDVIMLPQVDLASIFADLERAFPDIHDSVLFSHASENTLIIEYLAQGRSPVDDTLRSRSCRVLEFDDDYKIKRDYNYN